MFELTIIFWNSQLGDSDFSICDYFGDCFKCPYSNGICDYAFK